MKTVISTFVLGAALILPVAAGAVTVTATDGYTDLSGSYEIIVAHYTFDDGMLPAAFTGGAVETGTTIGEYAQPHGDATPYYAVGVSTSDPGTLNTSGQTFDQLSFYWGSIDPYNGITFNFADGTSQSFTGSDVADPAWGSQEDPMNNRTVVFGFSGSEIGNVSSVVFTSGIGGPNSAFELDDMILASAPEPATWASMIGGFGLIGGALRRTRRSVAAIA